MVYVYEVTSHMLEILPLNIWAKCDVHHIRYLWKNCMCWPMQARHFGAITEAVEHDNKATFSLFALHLQTNFLCFLWWEKFSRVVSAIIWVSVVTRHGISGQSAERIHHFECIFNGSKYNRIRMWLLTNFVLLDCTTVRLYVCWVIELRCRSAYISDVVVLYYLCMALRNLAPV